jgi:hypothetical protein
MLNSLHILNDHHSIARLAGLEPDQYATVFDGQNFLFSDDVDAVAAFFIRDWPQICSSMRLSY